ncbi:MAG TPA: hypothetical protein PK691_01460, partial [Thermomicrobiales bacterium]|nr:hypothetical protein [Thermomicrobiales bacterium]
MQALRLGLRAYRDFYDHIWWMLVLLVVWWVLNVTIVFGPPATLLLFHLADPRQGVWEDRLTPRECARYLLDNWARAWKLWLATAPVLALVVFNLHFYGGSDHALAVLAPIWVVLLVVVAIGMITIF